MATLNEKLQAQLDPATHSALMRAIAARDGAQRQEGYRQALTERGKALTAADTLSGLVKSWTAWFGAVVIAAPDILPALADLLPGLQPDLVALLGQPAANWLMKFIGLCVVALRIKTQLSILALKRFRP